MLFIVVTCLHTHTHTLPSLLYQAIVMQSVHCSVLFCWVNRLAIIVSGNSWQSSGHGASKVIARATAHIVSRHTVIQFVWLPFRLVEWMVPLTGLHCLGSGEHWALVHYRHISPMPVGTKSFSPASDY